MPLKRIPTPTQDAGNWGTILNDHLAQTQNPINGAFNSFDQFSARPTNLTADDAGRTYLYTQTGNWHEWSGSEWKVQNKSEINVKDYGAVGDGVADDTAVIQFCLDSYIGKCVFLPTGVYLIFKSLILPSRSIFRGSSTQGTVIRKNNNNPNSNGIRSVLVMQSKSDPLEYNSDSTVSEMFLNGGFEQSGTLVKNDYGIYADKLSTFKLDRVWITNCNTGIYTSDCFLLFLSNVIISEASFGITILTGTSMSANTVYCVNCAVAYNLKSLRYSTFNSCATDGASYINYYFENCQGITLNSCGAESGNTNGYCVYNTNNSNIIINAPFIVSTASYEKGIFFAQSNSKLIINNSTMRLTNQLNKFVVAETNATVTVDGLTNLAANLVDSLSYSPVDRFTEITGGKINKPIKESIFV